MAKSTPSPIESEYAAELAELASSARWLRIDPAAERDGVFRRMGRVDLLRRMDAAKPSPRPTLVALRLASVGVATFLFMLMAMPTLAGPGAVADGAAIAGRAVGAVLGLGPPSRREAPTATPNPPSVTVAPATSVSSAGAAGPDAVNTTWVSSLNDSATPTVVVTTTPASTATPSAGQERPKAGTTNPSADAADRADAARSAASDRHGQQVSETARSTPPPGQNHGQQVREEARDNHGHQQQEERRAEPTPPAPAKPEEPPGQEPQPPTPNADPTPEPPAGDGDQENGDEQAGGKGNSDGGKGGGKGSGKGSSKDGSGKERGR